MASSSSCSYRVVLIEKNGTLRNAQVAALDSETLFKKTGLKTMGDFSLQTTWAPVEVDNKIFTISLYGKTTVKAGQENKYEFPPPIDSVLYFGTCVVCNANSNITATEWEKVVEILMGGFDDLDNDEEDEDSEDDVVLTQANATSQKYLKDGFVVDDSEENLSESGSEENEDEFEEPPQRPVVKKRLVIKKVVLKPRKTSAMAAASSDLPEDPQFIYKGTKELEEEEYK